METQKLFGVLRSRTSRGVPEWYGGEESYIGSPVSATGKVSGVIGIVPGPPEGSRGSTGWGHLSRRAPWAEVGREPALSGLGRPPLGLPPCRWAPLQNLPGTIPKNPEHFPVAKIGLPIYKSLPPDHSGTPRDVRDLIRDSEQLSVNRILISLQL